MPPRWVQFVQQNQQWFKATDKVLTTLFSARGGGHLAMGLAGFSALGTVFENLFPQKSGWEGMHQQNLFDADLSLGGFFCDLLLTQPHTTHGSPSGVSNLLWFNNEGQPIIGALYSGARFHEGPFLPATPEALEAFFVAVRETVWLKGNELRITVARTDTHTWRASGRFTLELLGPLGPYVGQKQPADYAKRLSAYPPGQRTVVMRGPSGVGKSALARHVSRILGGPDTRVLKVSSEALKHCKSSELSSIVRCLQPTILLIDDLQLDDSKKTDFLLDLLEALRAPHTVTFVTVMTDCADDKEPSPGAWHVPGMRPGRVDEFWSLGLPDAEDRRLVIRHYAAEHGLGLEPDMVETLVNATEGLTGAYLANLVLRLATFGVGAWEREVKDMLLAAPKRKAETATTPNDEPPSKLTKAL